MSLYKKSKELREKRATIYESMKGIQKKAKDEARGLSAEEQTNWDKADKDLNELTSQVQAVESEIQAHEDRSAHMDKLGLTDNSHPNRGTSGASDTSGASGRDGLEATEARALAGRQAFRAWVSGGGSALNPQQRSSLRHGQQIAEQIPGGGDCISVAAMLGSEARALGTPLAAGVTSDGGYTVAEAFANKLNEAMKIFGGMRSVATIMPTSTGASMPFPTINDTASVGEIISENSQHNGAGMVFGAVTLDAFLYSSKIVQVSLQLLQDSAFDVEGLVGKLLGTRIGRITNTHFTTGSGDSRPKGLMTAATTKAAGAAAALTVTDLLDLKHDVDPAYRSLAKWMFNDTTLKALKLLTYGGTADQRSLWKPGMAQGEPDTIDGDPFVINQDVADIGASARSVAYGDFSQYVIRDCRDVTLMRLVERYADYLQVGFLAFSRHDGDLINTNAVHVLAHPTA